MRPEARRPPAANDGDRRPVRIACMQPYFLPYPGYFALIDSVDVFYFLTDVQYIRRGWIHRNRFLNRRREEGWEYVIAPTAAAPRNATIGSVRLAGPYPAWRRRFLETVRHRYASAPYYGPVFSLLAKALASPAVTVDELDRRLIAALCGYLAIDTPLKDSREVAYDREASAGGKMISLARAVGADEYLNAPGGRALYDPAAWAAAGVDLLFLEMPPVPYPQGPGRFVENLSIVDALMFLSPDDVRAMLAEREVCA